MIIYHSYLKLTSLYRYSYIRRYYVQYVVCYYLLNYFPQCIFISKVTGLLVSLRISTLTKTIISSFPLNACFSLKNNYAKLKRNLYLIAYALQCYISKREKMRPQTPTTYSYIYYLLKMQQMPMSLYLLYAYIAISYVSLSLSRTHRRNQNIIECSLCGLWLSTKFS